MCRVIRIIAKQTMVNYRTSTSFLLRETYPLPPYSTVVGMVHNVCGFKEWRPMDVSVQGRSQGVTSDLFTHYSFANNECKKDKGDKPRSGYRLTFNAGGKLIGVFQDVSYTELLCDVRLILHIKPERDEDFDLIYSGLTNPRVYPSLGRHEDLLDIEEVKVVNVEVCKEVKLIHSMYIPVGSLKDYNERLPGTIFWLHKKFDYDSKNLRYWKDNIETRYVGGEYYLDDILYNFEWDGKYPVAFA